MNFWDIETCALPEQDLLGMMPEFEAQGNLKDPVKIAANIEQKRADWFDKAALNAETGRVLAIGVINQHGEFSIYADDDERKTIRQFIATLSSGIAVGWRWAGWNIHGCCLFNSC